MIDITHKNTTLRVATAQAVIKVSKQETIDAINNKTVPKGDVFAMCKAVGLLGVKNTPLILADCHPLPIEYTGIDYEVNGLEITIKVTIKTIYKTGVEVEAMHGASVVALNMYDMLKPIDKGVEIHHIKLLNKKGGKSDYKDKFRKDLWQHFFFVCWDSRFGRCSFGCHSPNKSNVGISLTPPSICGDRFREYWLYFRSDFWCFNCRSLTVYIRTVIDRNR